MLTRNAAAANATKHLTELIPIEGSPVVEEHFLTDGIWQITLSYFPAAAPVNGSGHVREYKAFTIDGRSGEVISMKIRNPRAEPGAR
jgi:hypothetical protein